MGVRRAAHLSTCSSGRWPCPGPGRGGLPAGGTLPSAFAVSDLAQASVGAAGAALARLVAGPGGGTAPTVTVDRDLASAWFAFSIRPEGWELPPAWDAVAGDYATADGWIRLHTNAPHHRAAALAVLGVPADRDGVAAAVARWTAGTSRRPWSAPGCRRRHAVAAEWGAHPQGGRSPPSRWWPWSAPRGSGVAGRAGPPDRPLDGVRVLDLTRVLAGPVATRLLAGWGAEVLRIDPPTGRSRASSRGHPGQALRPARPAGARPGGTGCSSCCRGRRRGPRVPARRARRARPRADVRDDVRPGLVDVSLDAYGWTGPWAGRRGFDSLVQMSTGIAEAGRGAAGADRPVPLPVQALDQATGYLLAAAALTGLARRATAGAAGGAPRSPAWPASWSTPGRPRPRGRRDRPGGTGPVQPVELTVWGTPAASRRRSWSGPRCAGPARRAARRRRRPGGRPAEPAAGGPGPVRRRRHGRRADVVGDPRRRRRRRRGPPPPRR